MLTGQVRACLKETVDRIASIGLLCLIVLALLSACGDSPQPIATPLPSDATTSPRVSTSKPTAIASPAPTPIALAPSPMPTAQVQGQKATPVPAAIPTPVPPPGDCWNGVLSDDPLHCYILEEAQRTGHIDIVAIYLARERGPLYIFLSQTRPIREYVGRFLKAKAHEHLRSAGRCGNYTGDDRTRCFDEILDRKSLSPLWRNFQYWSALPESRGYEEILLRVGGTDGRRSVPGWASWSLVWPAGGRSARVSSGLDVSDVDVTNVPDPDCSRDFPGIMLPSCRVWEARRETGVAGLHFNREVESTTMYFQVKSPLPEKEVRLKNLKREVSRGFNPKRRPVEIIPVRYDFGQLWRWSVILNRFSLSVGNTVGIVRAKVDLNYSVYGDSRDVWINGVEPAGLGEWLHVRNILIVYALDRDAAVATFPELLPQLGIPIDAVGLVLPRW